MDKHDVYRMITFNRSGNVLKVNRSGKNSIRCQTCAKTEGHMALELYFNSRHPQHRFSAQQKMQHLRISWRNPCIWRPGFCQIIKYCFCFWMDHKSKQVYSLIDLWRQVATRWICPLSLKRAICSTQQTKDFLIWVLLVKRGHILAFYRPNFRLQMGYSR